MNEYIKIRRQEKDRIRKMIDEFGLYEFHTMLAEVCYEKGSEFANANVSRAADKWDTFGDRIAALSRKLVTEDKIYEE